MYTDALSFLEDERETFRPYEALDALTDEQLEIAPPTDIGWSGRDLMGHITLWQGVALAVAKELAIGEHSPTHEADHARWAIPGEADRFNDANILSWRLLPISDVRHRFRTVAGELRGYLTVVPESRWIKHPTYQNYFFGETTGHYEEHLKELRAVLDAVG
jgi:hypothetical protein